jgi:hypothetical protein
MSQYGLTQMKEFILQDTPPRESPVEISPLMVDSSSRSLSRSGSWGLEVVPEISPLSNNRVRTESNNVSPNVISPSIQETGWRRKVSKSPEKTLVQSNILNMFKKPSPRLSVEELVAKIAKKSPEVVVISSEEPSIPTRTPPEIRPEIVDEPIQKLPTPTKFPEPTQWDHPEWKDINGNSLDLGNLEETEDPGNETVDLTRHPVMEQKRKIRKKKIDDQQKITSFITTVKSSPKKKFKKIESSEDSSDESQLETFEKCAFCLQPIDMDTEEYFGPFKHADFPQLLIVHENCALFTQEVFQKPDGSVKNVKKAITRGRSTRCHICKHKGGTIPCHHKGCPRSYHYQCAKNGKGHLDKVNYVYLCQKHKITN